MYLKKVVYPFIVKINSLIAQPKAMKLTKVLIFLAFAVLIVNTAWLSDDIMLSFRQIWNASHGYGYTWNYDQRVQVFTHPAWALLLTAIVFITKELYFTTLVLSIALSLGSIFILFKHNSLLLAKNKASNKTSIGTFFIFSLLFSISYISYTSSGLENPLSYLLIGLYIYLSLKWESKQQVRYTTILLTLAALLFLNRFDYVLLLLPLVIHLIRSRLGFLHTLKASMLGAILVLAWFVFSIIYFGAPLPNTFYAKLEAGYPFFEVLTRGAKYFEASIFRDTTAMILIILGIIAGFRSKQGLYRALSIGIILYLLYILRMGGDFMLGRFFAILVYISIFNITSFAAISHKAKIRQKLIIAFSIICIYIPISLPLLDARPFYLHTANERKYYYKEYGLLSRYRKWPKMQTNSSKPPEKYKVLCGGIGARALQNGANQYFIDNCALADAFLSRLPAVQYPHWRIGHHYRRIPVGYGEYLTKQKEIERVELRPLLHDVTELVSGDLFSRKRWKAIIRINITKPYHYDKEFFQRYDPP